jgi:hypothetical protein
MPHENDEKPKLDIDWVRTAAAALAAVTSAVLLSTLGAVGTVLGAALGSLAATVGGAIYTQQLERTRRQVRRVAGATSTTATAVVDDPEPPRSWGERLRALSWKRVGLFAAGTFVAVMVAITGFELATGSSISQRTGGSSDQGTTVGGVTENNQKQRPARQTEKPEPTRSATAEPTEDATPSETTTPQPTATATVTETTTTTTSPTATPTPTPTSTPTPSATPSSTPSATATPTR